MAKIGFLCFNLIFSIFVFVSLLNAVDGIPEEELDDLLLALRDYGYHVFSDAIKNSDLRLLILGGFSFTLFAPSNDALFDLAKCVDVFDYRSIIHYHAVPQRFTFDALRSLPSGSILPTLLRGYNVKIEHPVRDRRGREPYFLTVDGASVSVPEIFYGRGVAVHGLDRFFKGIPVWWKVRAKTEGILSETENPLSGFVSPQGPPLQSQEEAICPVYGSSSNIEALTDSSARSPAAASTVKMPIRVSPSATQPPIPAQALQQQRETPLQARNPPLPALTINQPSQTSPGERILPGPDPTFNWPHGTSVEETTMPVADMIKTYPPSSSSDFYDYEYHLHSPPEYGDGLVGYAEVRLDTRSLLPVQNQVMAEAPDDNASSMAGTDAGATWMCKTNDDVTMSHAGLQDGSSMISSSCQV